MTRISPSRSAPPTVNDEEAAIARGVTAKFQWKTALLILLRLSAMVCMVQGLTYWMELLGLFKIDFSDRATFQQIAIVFFACMYCFAASGLWMTASWGVVLWIIALVGEGAMLIFEPILSVQNDILLDLTTRLGSISYLVFGISGVLFYTILSWFTEREASRTNI